LNAQERRDDTPLTEKADQVCSSRCHGKTKDDLPVSRDPREATCAEVDPLQQRRQSQQRQATATNPRADLHVEIEF
jgi:hypothetical protein